MIKSIMIGFMLAIGLLTILFFQFDLFTGKAGLLAQREIKILKLTTICAGLLLAILLGANHCAANMILAANTKFLLSAFAALLFTTAGNIIPLLNYSQ